MTDSRRVRSLRSLPRRLPTRFARGNPVGSVLWSLGVNEICLDSYRIRVGSVLVFHRWLLHDSERVFIHRLSRSTVDLNQSHHGVAAVLRSPIIDVGWRCSNQRGQATRSGGFALQACRSRRGGRRRRPRRDGRRQTVSPLASDRSAPGEFDSDDGTERDPAPSQSRATTSGRFESHDTTRFAPDSVHCGNTGNAASLRAASASEVNTPLRYSPSEVRVSSSENVPYERWMPVPEYENSIRERRLRGDSR